MDKDSIVFNRKKQILCLKEFLTWIMWPVNFETGKQDEKDLVKFAHFAQLQNHKPAS